MSRFARRPATQGAAAMEHLPDLLTVADKLGSPWSEILSVVVAGALATATATIYGYVRRSAAPPPAPTPVGGSQDLLDAVARIDVRLRELERGNDRVIDGIARLTDTVDRGTSRIENAVTRAR